MNKVITGVLAISLITAPAMAISWKDKLFTKLDADANTEISFQELLDNDCRPNIKFFNYADADRSKGLSRAEYFNNRDLFSRCK
jgi:hypothetical protein